jgi:hypothetical protein
MTKAVTTDFSALRNIIILPSPPPREDSASPRDDT